MSSKKKHSSCILKDKLDVLTHQNKKESATKLAAKTGKATVRDWKRIAAKFNSLVQWHQRGFSKMQNIESATI